MKNALIILKLYLFSDIFWLVIISCTSWWHLELYSDV